MSMMKHFEDRNIPASQSFCDTLEHALVSFASSVMLLNETISTTEFASRIGIRGTSDPRVLMMVHALLIVDGTVARQHGRFAISTTRARYDATDFPSWGPPRRWSEEEIRAWVERNESRLALLTAES
jgi:hypothetical protein